MNKIIFFDIENTLIPDWDTRDILLPLQHPLLKEWIIDQMPFKAGIFSFAVWHDEDIKIFNDSIRPMINKHLFFDFEDDLIFSSKEFKHFPNEWNKTPFNSADDNTSLLKKDGLMTLFWKHLFKNDNQHVILLDDTVEDQIMIRKTILDKPFGTTRLVKNNKLEFINPWTIIRGLHE